jgi:uncharacterized protein
MLTDEIEKLRILHQEGELSTDEYEAAVQQLIKQPALNLSVPKVINENSSRTDKPSELMGLSVKDYVVLMHLSQYAGFLIPLGGMIIPIVMWSIGREASADVDKHGREITNWIISLTIYWIVSIGLCCLFIGFPLIVGLIIAGLILPVVAALSSTKGEIYRYPLTMRLIK